MTNLEDIDITDGDELDITMDTPDGVLEATVTALADEEDRSVPVDMNGTTVTLVFPVDLKMINGVASVRNGPEKIADVTDLEVR